MQRLAEIERRRQQLMEELDALRTEENELRRNLAATVHIDPRLTQLVLNSVLQQGCAEAQGYLDNATPEERDALFTATLANLRTLLVQPYGAMFVQKQLENAAEATLARFQGALNVGTTFVESASTPSGARVLQRYMELVNDQWPCAAEFVRHLCTHITLLSADANASHLVQRALSGRVPYNKDALLDALVQNCVEIAMNKQGCCVLQRAIDWLAPAGRERIVAEVLRNELELVQDAFGNYVVQHLLDRKDDNLCKRTIQPLLHNVASLACNKFGSNVVEKCVRVANTAVRQLLIDELTDPSALPRLLQDSYANYVIQTAISTASEEQFQQLHAAIRPMFSALKHSPYGVRIEVKIQRRLKDNARARQRLTKKTQPQKPASPAPTSRDYAITAQLPVTHGAVYGQHFNPVPLSMAQPVSAYAMGH
jgi:hypothetical protein